MLLGLISPIQALLPWPPCTPPTLPSTTWTTTTVTTTTILLLHRASHPHLLQVWTRSALPVHLTPSKPPSLPWTSYEQRVLGPWACLDFPPLVQVGTLLAHPPLGPTQGHGALLSRPLGLGLLRTRPPKTRTRSFYNVLECLWGSCVDRPPLFIFIITWLVLWLVRKF